MRAKEILLIALGPSKREPILRMFAEGVTTEFPASFLTLHPNVSVMTDIPFRQDELGGVELYKGE
jgi:glucosamine-6-phosphate deaminase